MTSPQQAKHIVWDTLNDHFDATDEALTVDRVVEMTSLDRPLVENALRILHEEVRVRGTTSWQTSYPEPINGINRSVHT